MTKHARTRIRRRLVGALALALTFAAGAPGHARDVLMPGTKSLRHTHALVGLDAFPDHVFYFAPVHLDGCRSIREGVPFSWYKLHPTYVYAVPMGVKMPSEPTKEWFETVAASAALQQESAVDEDHPAEGRETVYRVTGVTATTVELELVRDEYLDGEGVSLAGDLPTGGNRTLLVGVSVLALCALGAIVVRRRVRA